MKFLLKIDCDNAVFDDKRAAEIARILRHVADHLEEGAHTFWLKDANGNTVGHAGFK